METKKGNILITGATGMVGTALSLKLQGLGYDVTSLSTTISNHYKSIYKWNPAENSYEKFPTKDFHAIINLAGASIADTPWNFQGKEKIMDSRVKGTELLKKIITQNNLSVNHFITASAVGIYGFTGNAMVEENAQHGDDFAAQVCVAWEAAARQLQPVVNDLSILRIGIVMGKNGGFYKRISDFAHYKMAVSLGDGKQTIPWIHLDDLLEVFVEIIEGRLKADVYNVVAENSSNYELTKLIAKNKGQNFSWPGVPGFMLEMVMGKKAEILLNGTPVSNQKIKQAGFKFKYQNVSEAIGSLAS